jgi:hypothetical protein
MNTATLKFGKGSDNAKLRKLEEKLGKKVFTFSLPAGYTCPGASKCLTKFDRKAIKADGKLGKIVDGPDQEFRCFAASMEAVFKGFRDNNTSNFEALKKLNTEEATALILASLPLKAEIIRIHISGDFFSESYFKAWCNVAAARPDITFYAYSKSLTFWIANRHLVPTNMHLTASTGGKHDALIGQYGLKNSKVVFSVEEAAILGLQIDHDDSHAAVGDDSFALLLHGMQAKGSKAAAAMKLIEA